MIIFSEITCKANTSLYIARGLVSGTPKCYDDLEGWALFDSFVQSCHGPTKVTIEVNTYGYGEGPEQFDATVEEVAYILKRQQGNPDFIDTRCVEIRTYKIEIGLEPEELAKSSKFEELLSSY